MVEPYEKTCYLWTRSEIRFLFYMRTVRSQTGTKVTHVGSATEMKSDRSEFIFRSVNAWKEMYGDRYELIRVWVLLSLMEIPPSSASSWIDLWLWFSLFSLKIDFNYPLLILLFDFWCVATVGRHSWQVVREAKNAVSVALKKLKLPWVKLWNCREYIEIAVSKIEIAVIKIAVSKLKLPWLNWNCREQIEIAVGKLKLPWANWNCHKQIEIAVSKLKLLWVILKLLWANWNCREQIEIALSKLKLPWHFWATVALHEPTSSQRKTGFVFFQGHFSLPIYISRIDEGCNIDNIYNLISDGNFL